MTSSGCSVAISIAFAKPRKSGAASRKMCSTWLSIHSPQYRSRRSSWVPSGTSHAEQPLEAVHGAHLVGDRADPADPRHDVGHLVEGPAGQERLEEPGRLVDLEPEIRDLAVVDRDVERALALHARDDGHLDRSVRHGAASSRSRASAASRNGRRPSGDEAEPVGGILLGEPQLDEPAPQRVGVVRGLGRPEAAVTPATEPRAQRAAPRPRDRAEARLALGHDDADEATPLALDAYRRVRDARHGAAQQRPDRAEELATIDRAPRQLEVDRHVVRDRMGVLERAHVLGRRVHGAHELVVLARRVAERLHPAARRAGADRDHDVGLAPDLPDLVLLLRRRDRSLDERDVVRTGFEAARRLGEIDDLDRAGELEQRPLGIEELELAPVARGHLEHRDARLDVRAHRSGTSMRSRTSS